MSSRGRKKLTVRKKSAYKGREREEELDEDESTIPDEEKWRTMTTYGLFAISDADGVRHRFKRGDIATILPQNSSPGDQIEPHEYWVGEILEIRADAGSQDSHVIWTKVRWFYNAEDAAGIVKHLDTSHIGKFERFFSSHWDFVLPHTFNEVIPLPKLHPYPYLKSKKSHKRQKLGIKRGDAESISAASTAVGDDNGDEIRLEDQEPIGPEMFYWRYYLDIVGRKIQPKPGLKSCLCSEPYSPDTTSLLEGVMFFCPRPTCCTAFHVGCLRGAKSVLVPDNQEVIVPTTTISTSKRGRGNKGKGKEKALEASARGGEDKDIEWLTPRAICRITCTPDSNHPVDLLSLLSPPLPSSTARHRGKQPPPPPPTSQPPPIIPLLQRVYARQLQHHLHQQHQPAPGLLHKHALSSASVKSKQSAHSSTKSGGSVIEIEDLLVVEDEDGDMSGQPQAGTTAASNGAGHARGSGFIRDSIPRLATPKSVTRPKSSKSNSKTDKTNNKNAGNPRSKQVQIGSATTTDAPKPPPLQVQPLSPATLLATLFLLPSPFPPSYASVTAQSTTTTSRIPHTTSYPYDNNTTTVTVPTAFASTSNATPNAQNDLTDAKDLLLLASQPLVRGAGYIPYLGPTGNVSLVLAARRLVWEVLTAVGKVELSTCTTAPATTTTTTTNSTSASTKGKKKRSRASKAALKTPLTPVPAGNGDNETLELDEAQQDIRDAEDFRKVMECVHSLLSGWKKRFKFGSSSSSSDNTSDSTAMKKEGREGGLSKGLVPTGGEVDDALVVKDGLIVGDDALRSIVRLGQDGDVEMVDGTQTQTQIPSRKSDVVVEVEIPLRSGKKRKRTLGEQVASSSRKKGKVKGEEVEGEKEGEEEPMLTEQEEEMLLRVDWACPSCGGSL